MARIELYDDEQHPTPVRQTWLDFKAQIGAYTALMVLLVAVFIMLFASVISPYSPSQQDTTSLLLAPAWSPSGSMAHLLGTDELGRDVLSRLLHSIQTTFASALAATFLAMSFGVSLGIFAGLSKGRSGILLNNLLDVFLTLPSLLVALILIAITGTGLENGIFAIAIALTPQIINETRIVIRTEWLKPYVTLDRLDGASDWDILRLSILPNLYERLVMLLMIALSTAIIDISVLGFLGLAAQQSQLELGALVADNLDASFRALHLLVVPGGSIFILVLCVNMVGEGLRVAIHKRVVG